MNLYLFALDVLERMMLGSRSSVVREIGMQLVRGRRRG